MKRRIRQRAIAILMTVMMVVGLVPAELYGGVSKVEAADEVEPGIYVLDFNSDATVSTATADTDVSGTYYATKENSAKKISVVLTSGVLKKSSKSKSAVNINGTNKSISFEIPTNYKADISVDFYTGKTAEARMLFLNGPVTKKQASESGDGSGITTLTQTGLTEGTYTLTGRKPDDTGDAAVNVFSITLTLTENVSNITVSGCAYDAADNTTPITTGTITFKATGAESGTDAEVGSVDGSYSVTLAAGKSYDVTYTGGAAGATIAPSTLDLTSATGDTVQDFQITNPNAGAPDLGVMTANGSEEWDFSSKPVIAADGWRASTNSYIRIYSEGGTVNENSHGLNMAGNAADSNAVNKFQMYVPAGKQGTLVVKECAYSNIKNAKVYLDGADVSASATIGSAAPYLKGTSDGENVTVYTCNNTSSSNKLLSLEVEAKTSFIHGMTFTVSDIPSTTVVSGSVTGITTGTLQFKAEGEAGVNATVTGGIYSVTLDKNKTYAVSCTTEAGSAVSPATLEIAASAADSLTGKDFTVVLWDSSKTASVEIGGTTFTVKAGDTDTSDFTVTPSGGDGSVELVTTKAAVVWANLGGSGSGSVPSALTTTGATAAVSGNEVTLTFADDSTNPATFKLIVRDNSATGIPAADGKTITYNLTNGSVISDLYAKDSTYRINGTVDSTDKLISFTSANKIYLNDTDHGIVMGAGDTVKVKVAGNAVVTFPSCKYSAEGATITASAETGAITVTDSTTTSIATKTSSCGQVLSFTYTGDATTLTFAISGTSYFSQITVKNQKVLPSIITPTHPEKVTVIPKIITTEGDPSGLTVTPIGQKLYMEQDGGFLTDKAYDSTAAAGTTGKKVSYYGFDATTTTNKLVVDVQVKSITSASNTYGVWAGMFDDNQCFAGLGVRNMTGLRGWYTKNLNTDGSWKNDGAGKTDKSITAGDTIRYTIYRNDTGIFVESLNLNTGVSESASNYKYGSVKGDVNKAANSSVHYGLMLAGVDAIVTNMKYYDKDGNILFDQNEYWDPYGTAPVVTAGSVVAAAADDRTKITVNWTGDDLEGDAMYVLFVSKDGGEWTLVEKDIRAFTYDYPLGIEDSGNYKFRVCGTLGNTEAQNIANRNTPVESNAVDVVAALGKPVVTLGFTSPTSGVDLKWTASEGAAKYEIYRKSYDENAFSLLATVTETSYKDTAVQAEVPYYYYVKGISSNNFSPNSDEVWTVPTDGRTGTYNYAGAQIVITKKTYDTVFKNSIGIIEGVVTAPGTVSLEVNGAVVDSQTVDAANGTFTFENISISEGRNDVVVYLDYPGGKTRKPLNFVYLTNYDYVVDPATATDGETTTYGVPAYKTVSAALTAVGSPSARKVILVREGSYEGRLEITGNNISLIGEDAENTIIHWNSGTLAGGNMGDRAAVKITGKAFSAENLTIQNDWDYQGTSSAGNKGNESADALHNESDGSMFVNVRLLGYQDTLCANKNKQYYNKCYIAGNVDFIYGNDGQALINDSDIVFRYNGNKNSGYVTAMKSSDKINYGIVINECRITAEAGCSGSKYYLGRPWGANAAVTYVNTYMSSIINKDSAWTTWGGKDFSTDEAAFAESRYYEFGSYGSGYAINKYRRQISPTAANKLSTSAGLGWDPYSSSATVSSSFYVGTKATEADDKVAKKEYNTDVYSWYEGDDTGLAMYDMEGYGESAEITGGGLLKESNSDYYTVSTAEKFLQALLDIKASGRPSVIEITADLNLGNLEVKNASSYSSILTAHNTPLTHPVLLQSGVSKLQLKAMNNITIFSKNGASLKHVALDLSGSSNIIIRNLVFDELWEWDEEKGDSGQYGEYDRNDWDYVTIESGCDKVWIDHCTFYKAYDGVVDMKTNADTPTRVTVSWCEFLPGSKNNTFFNKMMDTMAANPSAYPYYQSLLNEGMSAEQIWWYAYGQKKTHLLGQNDDADANVNLNVTFANNYYYDSMDRMPRLRFGNAHVYNCIMDAQELLDARSSISNETTASHIVSNGASSTMRGQLLLENCYINGIENPLNSGNGNSKAGYIKAINSLYYMNGNPATLTVKANGSESTPLILDADAFIGSLPYSDYHLYEAEYLDQVLTPGAGAGKMSFTVLQWEKTSYNADYVEPKIVRKIKYNVSEGIPESVMTDAVKAATGCTTPEMLVQYMIDKIGNDPAAQKILSGVEDVNSTVVDVTIQVSLDGGVTWQDATAENFPTTGMDIVIPYPDGTNGSDYDFVIGHLIVLGANGTTPGSMEYFDPAKTEDGLRVHIMSASPFVIGWVVHEETESEAEEDDDYYVPTTSSGNKYSELPLINHTGNKMVVTTEIGLAKLAAGITNDEYLEVEIDPLQSDNGAVKLIEALAAKNKLTVSGYMDVNVYRVSANGVRLGRVTSLRSPLDLLFAVPEGLDGNKYDFGVIRVHDGVAELLKDADNDPITITVFSDKFSAYAIVYGPKGSIADSKAGGSKGIISKNGSQVSPKTFDQSRFVPEVPETAVAEFAQKQAEQEVADLLITPQATKFPFAIVIVAILAMMAFIGGEVIYFRRKKKN